MNGAGAGPFGGVVPTQMVQAGAASPAAAGNGTGAAAAATAGETSPEAKAEARRRFARYVASRERELQKLRKRSYSYRNF